MGIFGFFWVFWVFWILGELALRTWALVGYVCVVAWFMCFLGFCGVARFVGFDCLILGLRCACDVLRFVCCTFVVAGWVDVIHQLWVRL